MRQYEREQCRQLDILGRLVSIDTHYQVLPLLREVKRERLPRDRRGRHGEKANEEEQDTERMRDVDLVRWEEALQEEQVSYEPVSLEQVFHHFQAVVKDAKTAVPRCIVLGPPGSGKTTLAQYLAWRAANNDLRVYGRSLVPARVRLREWEAGATQAAAPEPSLAAYLANHYADLARAPTAEQ